MLPRNQRPKGQRVTVGRPGWRMPPLNYFLWWPPQHIHDIDVYQRIGHRRSESNLAAVWRDFWVVGHHRRKRQLLPVTAVWVTPPESMFGICHVNHPLTVTRNPG